MSSGETLVGTPDPEGRGDEARAADDFRQFFGYPEGSLSDPRTVAAENDVPYFDAGAPRDPGQEGDPNV